MPQYTYSLPSLGSDSIRLLRLMPNKDKAAPIQCQLINYPFLESDDGTHIYEALSYVWGSSDKPQSVFIDGCDLPVTTNLYNALSRLRNRFLKRIIWVDSVCINQDDEKEKGRQIQWMAKIYSQADRVIVYLGEVTDNSDQALEDLRVAAEDEFADLSISEISQKSILKLLERAWFRRIWVLQEVAVARRILITCGPTQINGYAFCSGFNKLKLSYEAYTNLEGLIRSVTYLIRGAIFRPKHATTPSSGLTLDGLSLGELIDMYHTRESTERHDKVYALLGMSSDDPSRAGLSPDYSVPWKALFQQLIQFVLSKEASVETWDEKQVALIKSKGYVFGQVASVESKTARYDRQHVQIDFFNTQPLEYKELGNRWTLQVSAKSIQKGDFVCHLEGASKPTVIRLYKDHSAVTTIAVTLLQPTKTRYFRLQELMASKKHFPHELLLVWNWENSQEALQDRAGYDTLLLDYSKTASNKTVRLCDVGIVLGYLGFCQEALARLTDPLKDCEGNDDQISLGGFLSLALSYKGIQNWKVAENLLVPVVQKRKLALGMDHQATLSSIADLALVYIDRDWSMMGLSSPQSSHLPDQIRWNRRIPEEEMIPVAKLLDQNLMTLLLDLGREKVLITEAVLKTAAENESSGGDIMGLLLDRRSDILITEEVLKAAARTRDSGTRIVALLLEKRSSEVKITREVFQIAARQNQDLMVLILERRCEEVFKEVSEDDMWAIAPYLEKYDGSNEVKILITEGVLIAVSSNWRLGLKLLTLLLDRRGDEVKITEEVVKAVFSNERLGLELLTLLLDRRGEEVKITEGLLKAVADKFPYSSEMIALLLGNEITEEDLKVDADRFQHSSEMTALLLNRRGNEVKMLMTEKVVKKAVTDWNSVKVMELIINQYRDQIKSSITEEVVKEAARNFFHGGEIMELLVNKYPDKIKSLITKEVIEEAANNTYHCGEIMEMLVDKYPDEVKSSITERAVRRVARNRISGAKAMELLFNKYSEEVKLLITELVVIFAACNRDCGYEMIELLYQHAGIKATIGVIEAAAAFGQEKVLDLIDKQEGLGEDKDRWLEMARLENVTE